ncbi:potassium-transporting ATPase subunit C [Microvirga massiliensis]|uniref:potassium-transporting ATPase subunit C n=1 Tax=Microvirga massiliensis TaxID=1033741 RepID=UPI0011CC8785|nr:potassium-transporting ATPase subunit C [Microvirga massiliensis]
MAKLAGMAELVAQICAAPCDAANLMASDLDPTNESRIEREQGSVDLLKTQNPNVSVPIDLMTTSGSDLDPHIAPEVALFQVSRVAQARYLPEVHVRALFESHIEDRVLGELHVNVLALKLTLDALQAP